MNMRAIGVLCACVAAAGCVPRETIREVIVPARIPALCTSECPEPKGTPTTNGELAEAWAARGEAIACYKARQQCVLEMTQTPSKEKAPP